MIAAWLVVMLYSAHRSSPFRSAPLHLEFEIVADARTGRPLASNLRLIYKAVYDEQLGSEIVAA
jgi:hypothetical protein